MLTSSRQVSAAFWREHPNLPRRWVNGPNGRPHRPQNVQTTDTRVAFCDYVERLSRSGLISERLAQSVTLS